MNEFYVSDYARSDKRRKPGLASHQLAKCERQYRITPCPTRKKFK